MSLRDELYKEAMDANNLHPKLVEKFLTEELHKSAKRGKFFVRISAYAKVEGLKEITAEEIKEFAQKNELDYRFVSEHEPHVRSWHELSFEKE